MIEHTYQQNLSHINLGDYIIQFKDLIQQSKKTLKRILDNKVTTSENREKFSFHSNKTQTFGRPYPSYLDCFVHVLNDSEYELQFSPHFVEKAAEGILEQGSILTNEENDKQFLAQIKEIAEQLLENKESFLYKEMNRALREARAFISYFAKLMNYSLQYFVDKENYKVYEGLLYRGCDLIEDQKQEYLLSFQGKHPQIFNNYFTWYGYASTTKDRAKAENFGNTLFIISIQRRHYKYYPSPVEIEDISAYPNEKEVLSLPCNHFIVTDIKYENNKMKIYLIQTVLGF